MSVLDDLIKQATAVAALKIYVPSGLRKYVETETIDGATRLKKLK